MPNITEFPIQYPDLGRLYDELSKVLDAHRGAKLPRAAVIGVLVLLQDEIIRESWDEQNEDT